MVTTEKQTTVTALMHFSVRLLNRNDNSVLALWYGIPGPIGDRALKATLGHSQLLAVMGMEKPGLDPAHTGKSLSMRSCPLGEVRDGLTAAQGSHHPPKQCCWDLKAVLSTGTAATSGKKQSTRKRHLSRLLVGQVLSKGKGYRIPPPVPSLRLKDIGTATIKPVIFNWAWNDTTERKKIISLA